MTPTPAPDPHTLTVPRQSLARLVGRVVTVEASYTNELLRLEDGAELVMLLDVVVFPHAEFQHIWLRDLSSRTRRRLRKWTRFSFNAEVYRYTRANNSSDYGLKYVGGLQVSRG